MLPMFLSWPLVQNPTIYVANELQNLPISWPLRMIESLQFLWWIFVDFNIVTYTHYIGWSKRSTIYMESWKYAVLSFSLMPYKKFQRNDCESVKSYILRDSLFIAFLWFWEADEILEILKTNRIFTLIFFKYAITCKQPFGIIRSIYSNENICVSL